MNPSELMRRLSEYGADMEGIYDRFTGNDELYAKCFKDFIDDPNFKLLEESVIAKDYAKTFKAAHALKGLSGNLGLFPFYDALCAMVESLRAKDYKNIVQEYSKVKDQYELLKALISDEAPLKDTEASKVEAPKKKKTFADRLIVIAVISLSVLFLLVILMFRQLLKSYNTSTTHESASHLTEISRKIKLYIEEKIDADWRAIYSIANSINSSNIYSDEELLAFVKRERDIWRITDVMICTENGYGVRLDGSVAPNDVVSETVFQTRRLGEYVTIQNSDMSYSIPLDTDITYKGSKIVAISVIQSLDTFIDNMGVSSFDGTAYMYLTQDNGAVISKLTHDNALHVFNIMPLIMQEDPVPVSKGVTSTGDILTSDSPVVYMLNAPSGQKYLVSTPISSNHKEMRLFYIAPEAAVNKNLNSFSNYVLLLSITVIVAFSVGAMLIFTILYRSRQKQFDKELTARERMFDLLVEKSKTAFGLFSVGAGAPLYISNNVGRIIGEPYYDIVKNGSVYQMRNSSGKESEAIKMLNEQMKKWDGTGEFRSSFLRNENSPSPAYFDVKLYPLRSDEFVGIAEDVTPLYERETATREALAMAERANTAKSRFLSNMSHDIRTPMNAIISMTGFAMESINDPVRQIEYLQTLSESSEHLLNLINDVLDMSRIESGQVVIESDPFDIKAEMKRITDIARSLCASRHQLFIAEFEKIRHPAVLGDQVKLSQILMNLLSNASKFTPEKGAIRFIAEEIPALREDMVNIRFTVEDNGIGMSPADFEKIFEPFSRVDDRRVSKIEGTGLGLSICHSYVNAMGGAIRCESELGEGSIFTVELFFSKTDAVPESYAPPVFFTDAPFAGKRCLLCEDNYINQNIAITILERVGFSTEAASDGIEGLKMFQNSEPGYYDVIYMDIQMPLLDGYETTTAIRECVHPQAGTIPILAMTANVFAEDIEKARISGMDGHIAKPITTIELIEETDRALNKTRK